MGAECPPSQCSLPVCGQGKADPAWGVGNGGEARADGSGDGCFPRGAAAAENGVAKVFAQDKQTFRVGLNVAVMVRQTDEELDSAVRSLRHGRGEFEGSCLQLVPRVQQSALGQPGLCAKALHKRRCGQAAALGQRRECQMVDAAGADERECRVEHLLIGLGLGARHDVIITKCSFIYHCRTEPEMSMAGKIALVAGATRGAGRGIAVELGAAGAIVYVTGRTTRERPSEYGRPETIEETAELVDRAGGVGIAVPTDHLVPEQVRALADRIRAGHGHLDVLVNDIWGGELLVEWDKPVWEHDLANGLRMLHLAIDTHLITAHFALPLLIQRPGGLLVEVTDGTADYNARNYRLSPFYDLAKVAVNRMAWAHAQDLAKHRATAVSLTPGWLRSEIMLDQFGVTEDNWRDATSGEPHFAISETPRFIGRAVAALASDPDKSRWNSQSLSSGSLANEYGFTDLDGSRPDAWRYIVEVEDAGKPADTTGYR